MRYHDFNLLLHVWDKNGVFCFFSAVTEAGKAGGSLAQDFFREEYILNNAIGKFQCLFGHTFLITEA